MNCLWGLCKVRLGWKELHGYMNMSVCGFSGDFFKRVMGVIMKTCEISCQILLNHPWLVAYGCSKTVCRRHTYTADVV